MQIGKLASAAGVPVDTVRYYERRGLLGEPQRTASGYRDYRESDLERLRFIRRSKALGFTLDEIGELVQLTETNNADRGDVRLLASRRLAEVENQLRELTSVRNTLQGLVQDCSGKGSLAGCPIVARILREEH